MSFEILKSELDLFKRIRFQNSFEKSEFIEYRPTSSISASSTIDFEIPISTDEYLDTQHVYLEVDRKSTRLNSSHITRSRMPSSA